MNQTFPILVAATVAAFSAVAAAPGSLVRIDRYTHQEIQCPLKHTDVQADISGNMARVKVTQEFQNNSRETIEAIYVFPLPHRAAVSAMNLMVGDHKIIGKVFTKEEAQRIYANAKRSGQTAALLNQERPNIFTQAVANVTPGATVKVEIVYLEPLQYEAALSWNLPGTYTVDAGYCPSCARRFLRDRETGLYDGMSW